MINSILPNNKRYFDKEELIKAVYQRVIEEQGNLKNIVILDFSHLLEQGEIQDKNILLVHNEKPQPYWGSTFIAETYSKEKETKERESEAQIKETARKMNASRIPKNFLNKTFHDIERLNSLDNSLRAIKKYLNNYEKLINEGTGLFMFGGVGAGKTLLMSLLGKYLIKQGKKVIFYDTTDLFTTIKQSFSKDNNLNEHEILKDILACDVLIIDDLGAEKPTEWVLEKLFYIVNQRLINNKPILITSNYTQEELLGRLGDKPRIISRLLAKSINVQNKATDYRLIEHKNVMIEFKGLNNEN